MRVPLLRRLSTAVADAGAPAAKPAVKPAIASRTARSCQFSSGPCKKRPGYDNRWICDDVLAACRVRRRNPIRAPGETLCLAADVAMEEPASTKLRSEPELAPEYVVMLSRRSVVVAIGWNMLTGMRPNEQSDAIKELETQAQRATFLTCRTANQVARLGWAT